MTAVLRPRFTQAEYLAAERAAERRSEYVNGEILLMTGASYAHSETVGGLLTALRVRLKGSACRAVSQDLRTRVDATGLYTYPDVVIVCGEPKFSDAHHDTLTNPTAIFEVLSPSTESWDRGGKFQHYQRIASLQEYVLVTQDAPRVERFRRDGVRWSYERFDGLDALLNLESPVLQLPLAEIYEGLEFSGVAEPSPPPRS
ncbi:MAG: hypothetical protein JWQ90_1926 [Hydrocarboniphaga sp.]|uniref:Uma2 family endonuclease n=1 Tax=Hydrocarboniphaga sp. TaxID=2033016 RepID=UPI00263696CC|nr:Uma2 family endonuclease [Hydrocarboniphaga sp.]MDB5969476.1 hypothetical protein [Hydrocarboniphaga sp.]